MKLDYILHAPFSRPLVVFGLQFKLEREIKVHAQVKHELRTWDLDRTAYSNHNTGCSYHCRSLAKAHGESIGLVGAIGREIRGQCMCPSTGLTAKDRRMSPRSSCQLWMDCHLRNMTARHKSRPL